MRYCITMQFPTVMKNKDIAESIGVPTHRTDDRTDASHGRVPIDHYNRVYDDERKHRSLHPKCTDYLAEHKVTKDGSVGFLLVKFHRPY